MENVSNSNKQVNFICFRRRWEFNSNRLLFFLKKISCSKKPNSFLMARWIYLFASTIITKYHRLGGLKNKLIFLHFQKLQVEDQGVSRIGLFWGFYLWWVDGHLPHVLIWSSFCGSACPTLSSCKDSSHLGLWPTLINSF